MAGGSASSSPSPVIVLLGMLRLMIVESARAIVNVSASVIAGLGAGLITAGAFALQQPDQWDADLIRRSGPPLGPLMLGAGVGLLTTFVMLTLFSWRSRRRSIKPVEATDGDVK